MPPSDIESTDEWVNVPGGTIFVRRWNPSTLVHSTPLVLLHDSLGCVELWREFPLLLTRELGRLVVAYDRLGFGRSSEQKERPGPDFIRHEAEVVFPVLREQLGLADYALFGHSVGGVMALLIAARAGAACQAVVSESAQAFVEERTRAGVQAAKAHFQQPEPFAKLTRRHGAKAHWVLEAWTETWLAPEFATWSLQPDLPLVTCPLLVIHGDQDEYGSVQFPEFIGRYAGGPCQMHILPGCGHVPHRETPEVVAQLAKRFLS